MDGENMAELECGQCGNPVGSVAEVCPKCGVRGAVREDGKRYLVIDVAHAGETVEKALAKLSQAASEALAGAYSGLRVVHGYGSGHHHTSLIKEAVQKRLTSLRDRHGGQLIQDSNPGVTQWQIVRKRGT